LTLTNVDMSDIQGDKRLIDVLLAMGAHIEIDHAKKSLRVRKGGALKGIHIDVNDFIDAIPILSVIACFAEGTTEISGATIARKKESDRLHAIATELKKMGASIEEKPDGLIISHSPLQGATVTSWRDHRIAMSLAIAAMGAEGASQIEGAECISKTYPGFAKEMAALGASIKVIE
jgi:3-phosphoshikimate 1-carboxyvinyltransferase